MLYHYFAFLPTHPKPILMTHASPFFLTRVSLHVCTQYELLGFPAVAAALFINNLAAHDLGEVRYFPPFSTV